MKGMKKINIIRRIGIVFFVLLVGALTAGYIYQMMSVKKDEKLYKPPGTLYKVGNKKMHLYEGGSGDATVVFAAVWGTVNPYIFVGHSLASLEIIRYSQLYKNEVKGSGL